MRGSVTKTIPESVFFMFQLAFAVVTFALVLGASAERMRIGVSLVFCAFWLFFVVLHYDSDLFLLKIRSFCILMLRLWAI
jgi:ammonia channel protein AmtB